MVAIGKRECAECITLPPQWIALTGSFHGWWQQWGSRWLVNRHWRISSLNFCSTSETLALPGYIQEENPETSETCVLCVVYEIISRNKLILQKLYLWSRIKASHHWISAQTIKHLHCVHCVPCVYRDNITISQIVSAATRESHHLAFAGRLEQLYYSELVHIYHLTIANSHPHYIKSNIVTEL